jgi:hypothetical protein
LEGIQNSVELRGAAYTLLLSLRGRGCPESSIFEMI